MVEVKERERQKSMTGKESVGVLLFGGVSGGNLGWPLPRIQYFCWSPL